MPLGRGRKLNRAKRFTKTIEQGPNKGDTVRFQVAPKSGKPFPIRVVRDVGRPSTLRDNAGVKFGKKE
jgi:hypothetical protein